MEINFKLLHCAQAEQRQLFGWIVTRGDCFHLIANTLRPFFKIAKILSSKYCMHAMRYSLVCGCKISSLLLNTIRAFTKIQSVTTTKSSLNSRKQNILGSNEVNVIVFNGYISVKYVLSILVHFSHV